MSWLTGNGYTLPEGAGPVLGSYIAQGMKFFVARVNLEEHAKQGGGLLRPLQIAFESPDFMLPIRLGMLNSKGSQDLLLYTLTRKGRVETANYRTVRMPTDAEIPVMVKERFGETYQALYGQAVDKAGGAAVLLEYAWDMAWCDPCAADPLSAGELRELGVFWVSAGSDIRAPGQNVFVTRLHARYDAESFPEDLRLVETGDRANFQGRYILRHAFTGEMECEAGEQYRQSLPRRYEREAQTLASLTGWDIGQIRAEMADYGTDPGQASEPVPWWKGLWKNGGSGRGVEVRSAHNSTLLSKNCSFRARLGRLGEPAGWTKAARRCLPATPNSTRRRPGSVGRARCRRSNRRSSRPAAGAARPRSPCSRRTTGRRWSAWSRSRRARIADR